MSTVQWPGSREYVEAVQNPALSFQDPDLKGSTPALDRLGMPFLTSGNFAYVFKMNSSDGTAEAVRCFRGNLGDRELRYQRINDHLNKISIPYFADFEYDPQGILVGGRRYPIQVMEWIGGLPLDVYLENVKGRADVFKFLAELWLKVLASLRDGCVAHGDLQHGNIIVDNNSLRLVDLDGMYVPSMSGWKAPELGHRHYQHPKRTESYFDQTLDNFSGLVIYLSLLALKEQPRLWDEFHDENLIFTKADFDNPRGSRLFAKIKTLGNEQRRLADALEKACNQNPAQCPSVLDLVTVRPSRLPAWMLPAPVVTVHQATREAKQGTTPPASTPANVRTGPGAASIGGWLNPATQPSTSTIGSRPSQSVTSAQTGSIAFGKSAGAVIRHAISYAFMGVLVIWLWIPLCREILTKAGVSYGLATSLSIIGYFLICLGLGLNKFLEGTTPSMATVSLSTVQTPNPVVAPNPSNTPTTVTSHRTPTYATTPMTSRPQRILIGSKIRLIYHKPTCKWATKISFRNRVEFGSEAEARAAGYRRCSVCSP